MPPRFAGVVASGTASPQAPLAPVEDLYDEDEFWSLAHARAPYARPDRDFDDYRPAYRIGYTGRRRFLGSFQDAEPVLMAEWEACKGSSRLGWRDARHAARAAWNHVQR